MIFSDSEMMYQFYNEGFFGYGEKGDFKMFSLSYFIPIILLVLLIILLYRYRNFFKSWKHERTLRIIYAFVMMIVEMSYFWRLLYVGAGSPAHKDLMTKLPLQICQWTLIMSIFMLACDVKFLFDVDVFVCFTMGLIPFFYPSVISTTGPRYYRYYQYYLEHMMPILAVFYMIFVKEYRINIKKIYMPLIFLGVLSIPCCIANNMIDGANLMYIGYRTTSVSISTVLGTNMYVSLVILFAFASMMFALEYFIFSFVYRKKEGK